MLKSAQIKEILFRFWRRRSLEDWSDSSVFILGRRKDLGALMYRVLMIKGTLHRRLKIVRWDPGAYTSPPRDGDGLMDVKLKIIGGWVIYIEVSNRNSRYSHSVIRMANHFSR